MARLWLHGCVFAALVYCNVVLSASVCPITTTLCPESIQAQPNEPSEDVRYAPANEEENLPVKEVFEKVADKNITFEKALAFVLALFNTPEFTLAQKDALKDTLALLDPSVAVYIGDGVPNDVSDLAEDITDLLINVFYTKQYVEVVPGDEAPVDATDEESEKFITFRKALALVVAVLTSTDLNTAQKVALKDTLALLDPSAAVYIGADVPSDVFEIAEDFTDLLMKTIYPESVDEVEIDAPGEETPVEAPADESAVDVLEDKYVSFQKALAFVVALLNTPDLSETQIDAIKDTLTLLDPSVAVDTGKDVPADVFDIAHDFAELLMGVFYSTKDVEKVPPPMEVLPPVEVPPVEEVPEEAIVVEEPEVNAKAVDEIDPVDEVFVEEEIIVPETVEVIALDEPSVAVTPYILSKEFLTAKLKKIDDLFEELKSSDFTDTALVGNLIDAVKLELKNLLLLNEFKCAAKHQA